MSEGGASHKYETMRYIQMSMWRGMRKEKMLGVLLSLRLNRMLMPKFMKGEEKSITSCLW